MADPRSSKPPSTPGVQQALSYIRHCRTRNGDVTAWSTSLEVAVKHAADEGFRFSPSELRQAFILDYRMRLEVYRNLQE